MREREAEAEGRFALALAVVESTVSRGRGRSEGGGGGVKDDMLVWRGEEESCETKDERGRRRGRGETIECLEGEKVGDFLVSKGS